MDGPVTLEQSTMFVLWLIGFFSFPALIFLIIGFDALTNWVKTKALRKEITHFNKVMAEEPNKDSR